MRANWRGLLAGVVVASTIPFVAPALAGADPGGSVVINEINYHPITDGEEFLELTNPGDAPVDLSGACFTAGISGCFAAGTSLPVGGFVVAAQSATAYAAAFPTAPAPALIYTGGLSNSGETVTLSSSVPAVIDTVTYADAAPWPATADGDGPSLELTDPTEDNDGPLMWRASDPAPTPGAVNSQFGHGPGPVIADVAHGAVVAGQPITVTASVQLATAAAMEVTVGFAAPTSVPMADDGAHTDGAAGDGVYGGQIPGQPAGTLVRYRVTASNLSGTSWFPAEGSARPRLGLVVARPAVATPLPVIDWYISPADEAALLAAPLSNDYVPAVVSVGDQVWDGAEVRIHGNTRLPVKYSYKFKLPKGSPLVAPFLDHPVDEFVLDGDISDGSGFLPVLAASVYADSDVLMPQMAKVHVEQNGSGFGLFTFIEELDKGWRQRNGLDGPGDEQYEPEDIVGVLQDDGSAAAIADRYEKESPGDGDFAELYELIQVVDSAPTEARTARLRDLLDLPAIIDTLAVGTIIEHWDMTVHNYQLLRDGATGRWRIVPNDFDHTFFDRVPGALPLGPDNLVSALRSDPVFTELYLRRVRTLADRYLAGGALADRAEALAPTVAADVVADLARWPRPLGTQAAALQAIASYLDVRTKDLLTVHAGTNLIPGPATAGDVVTVAGARFAGEGGPERDWVRLANPSPLVAVDLTGWTLDGAGAATLPPGSVIPARGDLYVPADDLVSLADRPAGAVVAGHLDAGLDDAGGLLRLRDPSGTVRGQAVLADLGPPVPDVGLRVEAAADQVETLAPEGAGVMLTVSVRNLGPGAVKDIELTGSGTTCGRSLGALAEGASVVVRCSTKASVHRDRIYRFAAVGDTQAGASGRVAVRQLIHQTSYYSQYLLPAPGVGAVTLGPGNVVTAPVAAPAPPTPPLPTTPPLRWYVATGLERGRAMPTQGAVVAPTGVVTVPFTEGVPIRFGLAARSAPGTGARSPLTPFITPRPTLTWPFASASAQVSSIYEWAAGRPPTAAELSSAVTAIDGGTSPSVLVASLLRTGPWPVVPEPLIRLYVAYLGRPPDPSGFTYWLARRADGRTLNAISSAFATSPEFERKTGSLGNEAFVRFVYTSVLGRSADASGLAFWTKRLGSGWTRGRVMTSFSESSEGRRKLAPLTDATLVSVALLGRPPTATEVAPAAEWLRAGGSLLTVIDGIRSSDAHEAHVS